MLQFTLESLSKLQSHKHSNFLILENRADSFYTFQTVTLRLVLLHLILSKDIENRGRVIGFVHEYSQCYDKSNQSC